jgi:threonyl-tRNA synthetase
MSVSDVAFPFVPNLDPNAQSEPRERRLYRLRHSAAHIMAEAVLQIFPQGRVAIGPPIEHGFYYDFELPRPLTPDDLRDIEKRMEKICGKSRPFERAEVPLEEARSYFDATGQTYKLEIIDRILERAAAAGSVPTATLYRQSEFLDLCAGPHVDRTSRCRHFKLLSVAGAYWRGDATKPMLQRIYGTAWETKEDLQAYLTFLEEAKRRNHKRLGEELDLFSFHPESPGACFWHPRGVTLYQEFKKFWREVHERRGYVEIMNPVLYKRDLYIRSGHYAHYKENMFIFRDEKESSGGEPQEYCLKPMNCPDTFLFYNSKRRSFRELPLRVSEGGLLHRFELAGALNGLFRVRQFTQDDAHIFVTEDQVQSEIANVLSVVEEVYAPFAVSYSYTLSTRAESPTAWIRAAARSTDRRSTSRSRTASAGTGSAPPCSSTSSSPSTSTWGIGPPTTRASARSSSTAPSSAPSSASWASCSSTRAVRCRPGSRRCRPWSCRSRTRRSTTPRRSTCTSRPPACAWSWMTAMKR